MFKVFYTLIEHSERMWESLTPEAMKEYFWDTPLQARLIGYTTKEP